MSKFYLAFRFYIIVIDSISLNFQRRFHKPMKFQIDPYFFQNGLCLTLSHVTVDEVIFFL